MEKGKVVVIDDSPIVRKLAQIALEEEGYTVYTAEDGEQGYKVAEEIRPSLILVDFIMPKVSGYQVCKMVRENEVIKDTPIILITGKGDEAGRKFTEKFGVLDYFVKPFRSEALIEKVNSILQPSDGFSLDDVGSLEGIVGTEPEEEAISCAVPGGEPAGVYDYGRPPESPGDSLAALDPASEYVQVFEYHDDQISGSDENRTAADLLPEVGLGGDEPDSTEFPAVAALGNLFEGPFDFDGPVLQLGRDTASGDDAPGELTPFPATEEFAEVLSEIPGASLETEGREPLSVVTFDVMADAASADADVPPPEEPFGEDFEIPMTLTVDSECADDHGGTGSTAVTCDAPIALPAGPAEDTILTMVSRAVADCLDERLPAIAEGYDSRARTLLNEILEGGLLEAAIEKVLSRHFSTTLPSIIQDKTAEALTLLKEPPGEHDVERIVERVLSRHFSDNFPGLIREATSDIRNHLSALPGKSDVAATVESALQDSQIYNLLPALEERLNGLKEDMRGAAGRDDISDAVDQALFRNFPEDFAASVKDGITGLRAALDEMPRSADLLKLVDGTLSTHLNGIVQPLLSQHAAEVGRQISALPGRSDIEGILADFAARRASVELLPEFTRSLEDMLKQHGVIRAPGIILSGDAAHLDLARVLGMIASRGLTGRLSVYSVSLSSEMYLQEGTLCYASTSRQGRDPLLGKLLSSDAGPTDGLTAAREMLRDRVESAVHDTMTIREGKFYFEQGPVPGQLRALSLGIDPALCLSQTPVGALPDSPADGQRHHDEGFSR